LVVHRLLAACYAGTRLSSYGEQPLSAAAHSAPASGFARANVNHTAHRRWPRVYKRFAVVAYRGGASLTIYSFDYSAIE
jgi:hypothetical protein